MIKNIQYRITVDRRGKISTGKKSEKGYPQSLDHFNVTDFPELIQIYGEKPDTIMVYFPSDAITDFFDCNYVRYGESKQGNGTKVRTCDGEECLHRISETIGGKSYGAGEFSPCVCATLPDDEESNKKRCKYVAYLKAFIADPNTRKVDNPACYLFETHSKNSGDAVFSELEKIKSLNMGILRGIPFMISVRMIGGKLDAKQKFPIWSLQVMGMLSQIRETSGKMLAFEAPKQIESGKQEPLAPTNNPEPIQSIQALPPDFGKDLFERAKAKIQMAESIDQLEIIANGIETAGATARITEEQYNDLRKLLAEKQDTFSL